MELANGKNRESLVRKLREFAQILEGEYLSGIVERRGNDLEDDLASLYAESHDRNLADFLKSAMWTVACLTVDGRGRIIEGAAKTAAKLNKDLEPKVSWQEIAQLPTLGRPLFDRAARQLRHLADLLDSDRAPTIPPEDRTIPMSYRRAAKLMGKGDSQDAAEWLSRSVADGSIPCEHVTRQNHVFSVKWFPEAVWPQITPK